MNEIVVALITGLCVAIPNLYATYHSNKDIKQNNVITNKKLDDNEANNEAMKNSMIILLRSQIVSKCEKYQELGYLPDYARSCICDLFTQYTQLGGNHGVNILVDETLKIPSKKRGDEE